MSGKDSPVVSGEGASELVELICFLRSWRAFISRAFSGVIVVDDARDIEWPIAGGGGPIWPSLIDTPELVTGRPPLLLGLIESLISGMLEFLCVVGEMPVDSLDCSRDFCFFDPLRKSLRPAGNDATGRYPESDEDL